MEMIHLFICCKPKKLLMLPAVLLIFCLMLLRTAVHIPADAASKPAELPIRLPVIMYHSVYTSTPSDYAVTTVQLENDLAWLQAHGCQAVTAAQLCRYTAGDGDLPAHPVLITLDDGFYNNLSELLPLLEQYDMYAVISVVGSYTDNQAEADPHNPAFSYLTWEDIGELTASGRVEIGNHTYDMHAACGGRQGCARMPSESAADYADTLKADLMQLQNEMHAHLGMQPFVFAYPYGSLCKESIPVLRECGFLMTLTCREQTNEITRDPDCLYGLGRYNRSGHESTESFMQMLFG